MSRYQSLQWISWLCLLHLFLSISIPAFQIDELVSGCWLVEMRKPALSVKDPVVCELDWKGRLIGRISEVLGLPASQLDPSMIFDSGPMKVATSWALVAANSFLWAIIIFALLRISFALKKAVFG